MAEITYPNIKEPIKVIEKQVGWDIVHLKSGKTVVVKVPVPRGYRRQRVIL